MTIIVCGQLEILGAFTCMECEGPLSRGGVAAQIGRVCSEDCSADQSARIAVLERQTHLNQRDLLCDCAEYCAPDGLPTAEMRQEYADYRAGGELE